MTESAPRAIRVFISSTFTDMQAEREELVKRVFPELRAMCAERGVTFTEVDLRWGVTDEAKAEGKVLPICLDEIRGCRPYFLGLLGERYGWVPEEIPPGLVESEPWLAEHLHHSVTELEILHGVLNDRAMADHAFFYLRDAAYLQRLRPEQRAAFAEPDPASAEKLAALKERIRRSDLPVREDYPDPISLGKLVWADLAAVIDALYPADETPDPLQRQRSEHEAFARSRARVYAERRQYYETLDAHAAGDAPPLVVTGESGSGKSALLANWALRHREARPHVPLVMHFVGASAKSADWAAMVRRLMAELMASRGFDIGIPDDPVALRLAFADALYVAAARGRFVLMVDALNQLEDRDSARDLAWLPPRLPPQARLVVSTLPGRSLDATRGRGWATLPVRPLSTRERAHVVRSYLRQYRKELDAVRTRRIAAASQCANPLYLRTVLEELRLWGDHLNLDAALDRLLGAQTLPDLFDLVFARYEADYDRERQRLTRDSLTALWAARRGIGESELLDLLGPHGSALPRAAFSPLYLALRPSLNDNDGLFTYSHAYAREAARARFAPTASDQRRAHRRLAQYFADAAPGRRRLEELPWQLVRAKAWDDLRALLADLDFLRDAWELDEIDVKHWWALLEASSAHRMQDAYRGVVDGAPEAGEPHEALGRLLAAAGHYGDAEAVFAALANKAIGEGQNEDVAELLCEQGRMQRLLGRGPAAIETYERALAHAERLRDRSGRICVLSALGAVHLELGNSGEAVHFYRRSLATQRRSATPGGAARTLILLGNAHRARGHGAAATHAYRRAHIVATAAGSHALAAVAMHGLGAWSLQRHRPRDARSRFETALSSALQAADPRLEASCLRDLGDAWRAAHEPERALERYAEAIAIACELGDRTLAAHIERNRGAVMVETGRTEDGIAAYSIALAHAEATGDLRLQQNLLSYVGRAQTSLGRHREAVATHRRALSLARQSADKRAEGHRLGNIGDAFAAWGKIAEARKMYGQAVRLAQAVGDLASEQLWTERLKRLG